MTEIAGTAGYAGNAARLADSMEALCFEQVHAPILDLLPEAPSRVLEVGAGSGRDAAALASRGHDVVAAEPLAAFRDIAAARHRHSRIRWCEASLPDLAGLPTEAGPFDLVLATAVWMHLDAAERERAMPRVAALLRPGGGFILSLRHGPVPAGRRMFAVTGPDTEQLAAEHGFSTLRSVSRADVQKRPGVHWTVLALQRR